MPLNGNVRMGSGMPDSGAGGVRAYGSMFALSFFTINHDAYAPFPLDEGDGDIGGSYGADGLAANPADITLGGGPVSGVVFANMGIIIPAGLSARYTLSFSVLAVWEDTTSLATLRSAIAIYGADYSSGVLVGVSSSDTGQHAPDLPDLLGSYITVAATSGVVETDVLAPGSLIFPAYYLEGADSQQPFSSPEVSGLLVVSYKGG